MARSVASRYRADAMDPSASGQRTSTLLPASGDNPHRRPHLPSLRSLVASMTRPASMPVNSRLIGRGRQVLALIS
jgi:hypothetical protein